VDIPDVTFKTKATGKVLFSHRVHLQQKGLKDNCRSCHKIIYNLRKKATYTMADMEKGKSCGACHNGKKAFGIGECVKCHPVKEIDFKIKDAGNVKFSHTAHTGMYPCGECHDKLYLPSLNNKRISMADMEQGKSCGACHNAGTAFTVKENCDRCHKM
jgi:c(7)-type cytochrome triheme protein